MTDDFQPPREPPTREPMFNAPWPVAALIAALIVTHAWRVLAHVSADRFALPRTDLEAGRYLGLLTYLFTHGGWAHVLTNSAFTLAFGVPVARLMTARARGALAFFAFFLVCGVLAALGYAALAWILAAVGHPQGNWALIGASGAASGLMGAAALLIEGRGRIGPILGRTSVVMAVSWIAVNALLGLSGLTPGAAGMPVAWEAHIIGYFAGVFLIAPFARLAGVNGARRRADGALAR